MSESRITFRIDSSVKKEAQLVLDNFGITLAQTLREYLISVVITQSLGLNRLQPTGSLPSASMDIHLNQDDLLKNYEEELASYHNEFSDLITPIQSNKTK